MKISTIAVLHLLITLSVNAQILDTLWGKYYQKQYDAVLEEALPLLDRHSDNMELHMLIGRSYTDNWKPNEAIPHLKKVVENEREKSMIAWSKAYLGQCYFYIDNSDLAKKYLNECIDLNATPNATNRAKVFLQYTALTLFYDTWTRVETPHIRFHFQTPEYDRDYVKAICETYIDLNRFFNAQTLKKIDFYVWADHEKAKDILKMELAFARYSTISIHSTYKNTKGHELTHILCYWGLHPKTTNHLINEGVAVCFDQTKRDRIKIARDLLGDNRLDIVDLWTTPSNYPQDYYYAVGGAFIEFLLKNGTEEDLKKVLKNQSIENTKKVYKNFDEIMQKFNQAINQ